MLGSRRCIQRGVAIGYLDEFLSYYNRGCKFQFGLRYLEEEGMCPGAHRHGCYNGWVRGIGVGSACSSLAFVMDSTSCANLL